MMKQLLLVLQLFLVCSSVSAAEVNVFPYTEGFEMDFGAWTDSTSNDFDWSRNTGQTPSSGTGPIGAAESSWYIYTEASGNNPNQVAALEATFDISNLTSPMLSFYYHMYGSAMGELHIDVYDGSWTSIWQMVGQQQTWGDEDWIKVEVDLSAYTGSSNLLLRIRGVTGSNYTSDICVDKIRLFDNVPRVEVDPMNLTGSAATGKYINYNVTLTNKTGGDATFRVNYFNNPWSTIGSVITSVLADGQSEDMVIQVQIPSGTFSGDTSTSTVQFVSLDTAFTASASIVTRCSWQTWPFECETWDTFPNGWTNYAEGSTVFPWLGSGIGNPAPGLYHPAYTAMFINWFVSPAIDLTDTFPETLELMFDEFVIINEGYDYTGIFISTGSPDPTDGDFVELLELGSGSLNWTERKIDLTPYKGNNPIYIAFKYEGNNTHLPFIDNVCVRGTRRGINNSTLMPQISTIAVSGRVGPTFKGELNINGATGPDGPAERITAQVGFGGSGTSPDTSSDWFWYPITYTGVSNSNDVFSGAPVIDTEGTFDVAMRFMVGAAGWVYADLDGSANGYDPVNAGSLKVIPYTTPWSMFLPAIIGSGQYKRPVAKEALDGGHK